MEYKDEHILNIRLYDFSLAFSNIFFHYFNMGDENVKINEILHEKCFICLRNIKHCLDSTLSVYIFKCTGENHCIGSIVCVSCADSYRAALYENESHRCPRDGNISKTFTYERLSLINPFLPFASRFECEKCHKLITLPEMVDPKHNLLHYNLNLENDLNISASRNDSLSSRNLEKLETLLKQDGICFVENIDPTLEITKLAEGVVDHFLNFPRAGTIDKIDTQSFLNGNISNKQLQEHRIFPSTIGKIIEGGASCTKTSWKLRSSKHIWNFL